MTAGIFLTTIGEVCFVVAFSALFIAITAVFVFYVYKGASSIINKREALLRKFRKTNTYKKLNEPTKHELKVVKKAKA